MPTTDPTSIDQTSHEELERLTLAAIRHELGLGGLARFLMTHRSGKGGYTVERRQWVDTITVEDIAKELNIRQ